jgi:membrane-bound inhibitor of C-type lysozyme
MLVRSLVPLLLLAACGTDADPEAGSVESTRTAGVVAPQYDTLMSSVNMRCDNGTEIRANVYVGNAPRVVLATQDTGMVLAPRVAASGTRYATADEAIVWWSRGDSGTLTFRGTTTSCGPADDVVF